MARKIFIHAFPDFLEIQRFGFLDFFIQGLPVLLKTHPWYFQFKEVEVQKLKDFKLIPKINLRKYGTIYRNEYLINPSKYYLKLPTSTSTLSRLEDLTYCSKLYIFAKKRRITNKKENSDIANSSLIKYDYNNTNHDDYNVHYYNDKYIANYLKKLKVLVRKKKKKFKKFQSVKICLAEIPLMADDGSFIIGGTERTIINQMIRCPGASYRRAIINKNLMTLIVSIVSQSGSWFTIEVNENFQQFLINERELVFFLVTLDSGKTFSLEILLLAFGINSQKFSEMSRYPFLSTYIFSKLSQQLDTKSAIKLLHDIFFESQNDDFLFDEFYQTSSENFTSPKLNFNFYNSEYFCLGVSGRGRLNNKFCLNFSHTLIYITPFDLVNIVDGLIDLKKHTVLADEIDNLSNKAIKHPGTIFQDLFRIGLERLYKHREEFIEKKVNTFALFDVFEEKCFATVFKEFFNTSEISQFLDNLNPLADLTHKRKVTVLGQSGISAETASFVIRDIHASQYGRLCPIETPEGKNAGLVTTLTTCSQLNLFGSLEAPYFFCKDGKAFINQKPRFLDASSESKLFICSSDISLSSEFFLGTQELSVRLNNQFYLLHPKLVEFFSISPLQLFSIGTSLVPFFEHNDANRVLMGANMQRQAVPLLCPQKPLVGTGLEFSIAFNSGMIVKSYNEGRVISSSSEQITVEDNLGQKIIYPLKKYLRTNGNTFVNQKPLVWVGEKVLAGQVISDGPSILSSELALGRNLLLAYMPWEGYNFEDAVIISERVVFDDLLTSIHIEEYETDICETVLGPERLTNDVKVNRMRSSRYLSNTGLVLEGSYVRGGDILVGKVIPSEEDASPESRILSAIFGQDVTNKYKDSSLVLPKDSEGRVIDIRMIPKPQFLDEEDASSIIAVVKIYIARTRKIIVGDKVAGRHGNKGVISKILPIQDMPYLPDGTPVDILFNPLGVPSRMNVGQLFECLLGFAGSHLSQRFKIVPFDETFGKDASRILVYQKLYEASLLPNQHWILNKYTPGKLLLQDGRTGEYFDNPIFLGKSYIVKLMHLVEDKIHARATGPYSLITQQPLGGRSNHGGQRFGEMEVWALQAYGAAYSLQELLTIRSDDIDGRNYTYDALLHGRMPAIPQIPEAYNVLVNELRGLGFDLLTYRLNLNYFSSRTSLFSDKSLFNSLNVLEIFEKRLKLQRTKTYLNPRARVLGRLHRTAFQKLLNSNSSLNTKNNVSK